MSIQFEQITKRYRNVPVVNDISLEIGTGEFFVLLGPSGSGKSTLLRSVAGLTSIDHGRISLHGRDVTNLNPRERGVGFVFQHYALFRNMSVGENIEFALRVRGLPAVQRRARRRELLRLVALEGMDDRLPSQLSGGQQQRVAVARALAHEPAVLLLDEPFGALDARIRVELRRTVRDVQRRLGTTTILVTHDQEEAFALADRIGVMHQGRLLETGRPQQLYRQPTTRFVATFLGAANLLLGELVPPRVRIGGAIVGKESFARIDAAVGTEVVTVVRPEDLEVARGRQGLASPWIADGEVVETSFGGGTERLIVRLAADSGVRPASREDRPVGQHDGILEITRNGPESTAFPISERQGISIGLRRAHVLPTPVSSFTVRASTPDAISALRDTPLLAHLARSMQARLRDSASSDLPTEPVLRQPGVVVVESGERAPLEIAELVSLGANRILSLPRGAPPPKRMVVYCPAVEAQAATMGLVASIARHLPVETILVSFVDGTATRAKRMTAFRSLLDARAEVRTAHGLDLRTELHTGNTAEQMQLLVAGPDAVLLVIGLAGVAADLEATLSRDFSSLFAPATAVPAFIVHDSPRIAPGLARR